MAEFMFGYGDEGISIGYRKSEPAGSAPLPDSEIGAGAASPAQPGPDFRALVREHWPIIAIVGGAFGLIIFALK